MIEPSRLAAFIASRICHDLISPVGSVNSALELLDDPGDAEMKLQAEQLLHNGARDAAAKIQLLRYAFGSAGLSNSTADQHEVRRIIEDFMNAHKPDVEIQIEATHFSYAHARVMMNLVLLATAAIPRGGMVSLSAENLGEGLTITATAKGPRARLADYVEAAFEDRVPDEGWSARTIQPLFTQMVVEELGGVIRTSVSDEQIVLTASNLRPNE